MGLHPANSSLAFSLGFRQVLELAGKEVPARYFSNRFGVPRTGRSLLGSEDGPVERQRSSDVGSVEVTATTRSIGIAGMAVAN